MANRFGNPTIGPAFEYNETSATFIGATIAIPLPVYNLHRGDILGSRQAEKERAMLDQRRLEVQIALDLQIAEARLAEAKKTVDFFEKDVLPTLKSTVESLDKLFTQGDPGVDVLRLIDTQRRLIRAAGDQHRRPVGVAPEQGRPGAGDRQLRLDHEPGTAGNAPSQSGGCQRAHIANRSRRADRHIVAPAGRSVNERGTAVSTD